MSAKAGVSVRGSLKFSTNASAMRCFAPRLSMRPSLPYCAMSSSFADAVIGSSSRLLKSYAACACSLKKLSNVSVIHHSSNGRSPRARPAATRCYACLMPLFAPCAAIGS
jgi:hypothetical protein